MSDKFWWEDGYVRPSAESEPIAAESQRIAMEDGAMYMEDRTVDGASHCLQTIFDSTGQLIISLCDTGKTSSSINVYQSSNNTLLRCWDVDDKCGYMTISADSTLLALGVLKEDRTMIFDFATEELLINLRGGQKTGFFGQLAFVDNKNFLIELRVISQDNRGPKKSICRLWDLGFKQNEGAIDVEEDEDDEVESKLWEFELKGCGQLSAESSSNVFITWESERVLNQISFESGRTLRSQAFPKWTSKCISSSRREILAVSHFGCCSILDALTWETKFVLLSPIVDDKYPLVPIAFINNDEFLVCRINYNMTLVVYSLKSPSTFAVFRNVGATISDSTVVSPDSKRLICWPYGAIEIFNMVRMSAFLDRKLVVALKREIVRLRELFFKERSKLTSPSVLSSKMLSIMQQLVKPEFDNHLLVIVFLYL